MYLTHTNPFEPHLVPQLFTIRNAPSFALESSYPTTAMACPPTAFSMFSPGATFQTSVALKKELGIHIPITTAFWLSTKAVLIAVTFSSAEAEEGSSNKVL